MTSQFNRDNGELASSLAFTMHTLPSAFQATWRVDPDAIALRTVGGKRSITWRSYGQRVRRIAEGLDSIGLKFTDTLGIMLVNRPEFHLIDTAALHLGAVPFSIYNTMAIEQIRYVCANAGNRIMVTERRFLRRLLMAGIAFDQIVCVDGRAPGVVSLADLIRMRNPRFGFEATWRRVHPSDLATITYTSGTTGAPKGVELTHENILAQLDGLAEYLPTGHGDRIVSYLPAAHIADRITAHYAGMARGVQVTSISDPRELAPALADTRPTVLFGVPNVWQKMQNSLDSALAAEPRRLRRATGQWALGVGRRSARAELAGTRRGAWLRTRHRIATTIVLAPLRRRLGLDDVRFAASGAAPIPADVLEYFHGLGIRVTEVWGLSEAAGVSTTTTVSEPALGTVGKPLPSVEIKLARDGEVLVRGPMVMRGYYNDPEATARVLDSGGWLATGDLGEIDELGNLRIVGRRSEMIINSAGKNIAPANIESTVRAASFLIGQVMVIGDRLPYVTALITLDVEAIAADAQAEGFAAADVDVLAARPSVRHRVTEAVREGNRAVSRPEQIKRFLILDHPWSVETGELTPKSTLRRAAITARYADLIESLYADRPDTEVIDLH